MYEKIILAFDGSHEARTALREGALLGVHVSAPSRTAIARRHC